MVTVDESDRNYPELVEILRQLKPTDHGLSVEDTFYAAGWNAANASFRRAHVRNNRRSGAVRFASGLVCGFLFSVAGLLSWQFAGSAGPETVRQSAPPSTYPEHIEELVAVEEQDITNGAVQSDGPLADALALLRPWNWIQPEPFPSARRSSVQFGIDLDTLTGSHLGMRTLATASPQTAVRSESESVGGLRDRPLNAFPLSAEMIDDLL